MYEEVVLWFEHDLYDQLQLVQILDRLQRWNLQDKIKHCAVGAVSGTFATQRISHFV